MARVILSLVKQFALILQASGPYLQADVNGPQSNQAV